MCIVVQAGVALSLSISKFSTCVLSKLEANSVKDSPNAKYISRFRPSKSDVN